MFRTNNKIKSIACVLLMSIGSLWCAPKTYASQQSAAYGATAPAQTDNQNSCYESLFVAAAGFNILLLRSLLPVVTCNPAMILVFPYLNQKLFRKGFNWYDCFFLIAISTVLKITTSAISSYLAINPVFVVAIMSAIVDMVCYLTYQPSNPQEPNHYDFAGFVSLIISLCFAKKSILQFVCKWVYPILFLSLFIGLVLCLIFEDKDKLNKNKPLIWECAYTLSMALFLGIILFSPSLLTLLPIQLLNILNFSVMGIQPVMTLASSTIMVLYFFGAAKVIDRVIVPYFILTTA